MSSGNLPENISRNCKPELYFCYKLGLHMLKYNYVVWVNEDDNNEIDIKIMSYDFYKRYPIDKTLIGIEVENKQNQKINESINMANYWNSYHFLDRKIQQLNKYKDNDYYALYKYPNSNFCISIQFKYIRKYGTLDKINPYDPYTWIWKISLTNPYIISGYSELAKDISKNLNKI